jgi:hypothetical protein
MSIIKEFIGVCYLLAFFDLKEWMPRFHGVAIKNLPNCLGWFHIYKVRYNTNYLPRLVASVMLGGVARVRRFQPVVAAPALLG